MIIGKKGRLKKSWTTRVILGTSVSVNGGMGTNLNNLMNEEYYKNFYEKECKRKYFSNKGVRIKTMKYDKSRKTKDKCAYKEMFEKYVVGVIRGWVISLVMQKRTGVKKKRASRIDNVILQWFGSVWQRVMISDVKDKAWFWGLWVG